MPRHFPLLLLVLLFLLQEGSAQPRESVEGRQYSALPVPVATETDADRIEVRELFWYGCPACAAFSPMMSTWRDGVTGDLSFARTPLIWNETMALHARIFYAARELSMEDQIHHAAFQAIKSGNPLNSESLAVLLFQENGASQEKFLAAWNSSSVNDSVTGARQATQDYNPDKLPAVILNGRYLVTMNQHVTNPTELNIAVNMLIRTLRDERRNDF